MTSLGIFTYSSKPRGSVVHAASLAEALERQGAKVTLYALSKPGDSFYRPVSCALELIAAGPAPSETDALIRQRIAEFRAGIRARAPRHAVCHAEDCLAANALVEARADLGRATIVRTVHHVERFESPYLMQCQARSVAEADLVFSVSRMTRRDVLAEFGREAPVISNGVDLARFTGPTRARERYGLPAGESLVLSVGGVEARKNSLNALEAIRIAHAERPGLRWLVAGGASIFEHDAYRAEFARRVAELPSELRARITVLGTVSEAELTELYLAADVLLCPSLHEGFGLCVLEALASKTAVVVSRGEPFDEYLDERCAAFVDPSSPADIARGLLGYLRDDAARARATEQGVRRARDYSWDIVAQRHLTRYESSRRPVEPARYQF